MELREADGAHCRAAPVLSTPTARLRHTGATRPKAAFLGVQHGCSPGPGRAPHHAAGSHRGWGKPGVSPSHSPWAPPASLIPLPTPRVVAALLSPPPPHVPNLRDPPLAQSLPLVPEKSCKTPAAWSCYASLHHPGPAAPVAPACPRISQHLSAPHGMKRLLLLEPPPAAHEAKPGLGREKKMGRRPRHRAAHRAIGLHFAAAASPVGTDSPPAGSAAPLLRKLHGIL